MHKHMGWFLLLLASPALGAEERTTPGVFPASTPPEGLFAVSYSVPEAAKTPSAREISPPEPSASAMALAELNTQFQQLKSAREALVAERLAMNSLHETSGSLTDENAKLRVRVRDILTKLAARKKNQTTGTGSAPPKSGVPTSQPATKENKSADNEADPPVVPETTSTSKGARPLDPLALAHSLFQSGNFEAALKAYRMIELKGMKAEERLPIQYMTATCLKRLDKIDEAITMYREVANSRGDEHLALCAQWQLSALRWQRELLSQLTEVRQRRQALEKTP